MASKIKVKLILELRAAHMSRNSIADMRGMSRNSVSNVFRIADEMSISYDDIMDMDHEDVYRMFFPDKHAVESVYKNPDYDYVHLELKKVGVNLKLLWKEYQSSCNKSTALPMGYTKYCRGYRDHTSANNLTNHLMHKPGMVVEVDWSGSTMSFVDRSAGEIIKVNLFVARFHIVSTPMWNLAWT